MKIVKMVSGVLVALNNALFVLHTLLAIATRWMEAAPVHKGIKITSALQTAHYLLMAMVVCYLVKIALMATFVITSMVNANMSRMRKFGWILLYHTLKLKVMTFSWKLKLLCQELLVCTLLCR
jgi:hypothetical protein